MIVEVIVAIVGIIIIRFVFTYLEHLWSLSKYPKGPFPLPLIGNVNLIQSKNICDTFTTLSKKYGNVFSFSMGTERVVVLNEIESIREALTKGSDFAGKSAFSYFMDQFSMGFRGIVCPTYSKKLVFMRKLAFKSMHLYGDGLKNIEKVAIGRCEKILSKVESLNGKPINVFEEIENAVIQLICYLNFGDTFENDPNVASTIKTYSNIDKEALITNDIIAFAPWVRYIYHTENYKKLLKSLGMRNDFITEIYNAHKQNLDPNNLKGVADNVILLCQDKEFLQESGVDSVDDADLKMVISDLILASVDTTVDTLEWLFLYLLHHPEYQDKIFEELFKLNGPPTAKDMSSTPFLQATILETQRCSNLVYFPFARKTMKETSVAGHKIPNDTTIFLNYYGVHRDERFWDSPEDFKPDRFLYSNGKIKPEKDYPSYVAFGLGTRSCLGEKMAKVDVYAFAARILSRYKLIPDPNDPPPCYKEASYTLTRLPVRHFNAIFKPRF